MLSDAIVWSVTKLASITFLSLALSYWIDYLGFITEGKLAAVLITPSLGVPNWSVIYIINTAPSPSMLFLGGKQQPPCSFMQARQRWSLPCRGSVDGTLPSAINVGLR
jgi:hypothetical protein